VPPDLEDRLRLWSTADAPVVIADVDAQGVAHVVRLADAAVDAQLPPRSIRIRCQQGDLGWQPGPDSWFIKEGTGDRYRDATFARLRVHPDGTVRLLGLATADRTSIAP
jgi:hypothetical protein